MLRRLAAALLLASLTLPAAGCGQGPLLRDDYMGRSWLEPDRQPAKAARDANGNPVLPQADRGQAVPDRDG